MSLYVIRTDRGLFWGPRRGGYRRDVEDAGLYTKQEADQLASHRRCGQDRCDEVLPAEAFCDELHAKVDRITEFLVTLAMGRADDAVDPHVSANGATDTGTPTTRV